MSVPTHQEASSATHTDNADLDQRLNALHTRLRSIDNGQDLDYLWDGVRTAVQCIKAEHGGMANELLGVYEQLGTLFDVTRRLASVQSEDDLICVLIDGLQRSFSQTLVSAYRVDGSVRSEPERTNGVARAVVGPLIQRAFQHRGVVTEALEAKATKASIVEIMVVPMFAGEVEVCALVVQRSLQAAPFQASDMLLLESLALFCGDLVRNHRLLRELREMSLGMVRSLVCAVDQKDQYTSGHSLRVAYYATLLAKGQGLGAIDLQMLQWSALLHDVGKIGIRDNVLNKVGKLTASEWDHMREHPVRSHQVVKDVVQLRDALDGVLYHHERYDGTGYPSGLRGENIPLQARIIQIADVFDALTSNRSYRDAYSWSEALDVLKKEAGTTVDPGLQASFEKLIRDRLSDNPEAWAQMVEQASRFLDQTLVESQTQEGA